MELSQMDWQVGGLTLNIVGVYFIVNSLILKKPRRFLNDYFGVERRRPLSAIRGALFAQGQLVAGFVFVIAGYFMQVAYHLAGIIDDRASFFSDPSVLMVAAILVGSTVMMTLALKVCQIFWTRWYFRRQLMDFFRSHPGALERSPNALKEVGEVLGVDRSKEDSVAEYLDRLRAFLGIDPDDDAAPRATDSGTWGRTDLTMPSPKPIEKHPATPPRI